MKKVSILLLLFVLIFSGCKQTNSNEDIFSITQNSLTYKVISSPEDSDFNVKKTLIITNNKSKKEIQKIHFTDNEWFTEKPLYLVDITFDGNLDIIVPYQRAAGGAYFQGYIWDDEVCQYICSDYFQELPNVALDEHNKTLLSHKTADKITTYGIHKYSESKKDFIITHSLYWEPQDDENYMIVTENKYNDKGEQEKVKKFTVSASDTISIDKTNPQMLEYYEKNSLWDLDSNKWEETLYNSSY
ncbi:MAG: hypothetical protein IKT44_01010 [Clostridia bacterium]|nr:hypothetical protein [Clostridia bacterium]